MALSTAASASALVAARSVDATRACEGARLELQSVLADNASLLPPALQDAGVGACTGPLPVLSQMPALTGGGSFAIWFGYGAANDTFCRAGGAPTPAGLTDGDVMVALAFRPNLSWIPLVGGWMAPTLRIASTQKVDPFRSRDPGQDPTGDNC
jgi:hypothetical protein